MLTRIIFTIVMFIIGAILGSFACCQAWRLHYKEEHKKSLGRFSVCLNCGKRLSAKENIPIFSWIAQKGKCRHCGHKIGRAEILSEIGFGLSLAGIAFVAWPELTNTATISANAWFLPVSIASLLVLIISLTVFWILLIYDAKWQKLPQLLLTIAIVCAIIYVILHIVGISFGGNLAADLGQYLLNLLGAIAVLPALYFVLYFFSKERLVGSGDWLLALPIALFLGGLYLAVFTLFLSNFIASVYGLIARQKSGKKTKNFKFAFGPFLVLAFIAMIILRAAIPQPFLMP